MITAWTVISSYRWSEGSTCRDLEEETVVLRQPTGSRFQFVGHAANVDNPQWAHTAGSTDEGSHTVGQVIWNWR